jgi:hypothetical protein
MIKWPLSSLRNGFIYNGGLSIDTRGSKIIYGEWLLKARLLRLAAFGGGLAMTKLL